ncbi:hypothetical protein DCAR_0313399 [Daucus carota subsp. sativus]|uniref:Uncharacterized protein n=1 Tax=Daucus carota subsp. sativus TaxID=79200 RepID=A0A166C016_DAUCS|nr:hypothetical protein DCAR_0313399 [Daucus carota subsp. sativus]
MSTADSLLADPLLSCSNLNIDGIHHEEGSTAEAENPQKTEYNRRRREEELGQKYIEEMHMRRLNQQRKEHIQQAWRYLTTKKEKEATRSYAAENVLQEAWRYLTKKKEKEPTRSYAAENVLETHVYEDRQGMEYIREVGDARSQMVYVPETVDGYKQGIEYIREAGDARSVSTVYVPETGDGYKQGIEYIREVEYLRSHDGYQNQQSFGHIQEKPESPPPSKGHITEETESPPPSKELQTYENENGQGIQNQQSIGHIQEKTESHSPSEVLQTYENEKEQGIHRIRAKLRSFRNYIKNVIQRMHPKRYMKGVGRKH